MPWQLVSSMLLELYLKLRLSQVWRPTRGPVDSSPLAMIDASTVAPGDLMGNVRSSLLSLHVCRLQGVQCQHSGFSLSSLAAALQYLSREMKHLSK